MHFEIDRRDIHSFRVAESTPPEQLAEGQVVLRLERAALTSNNVTYALTGDMLDYWGFFPTEAGWGRLPVMGFGVVTSSANPDIAVGGRYFGFYPLGDHHVVQARAERSSPVRPAKRRALSPTVCETRGRLKSWDSRPNGASRSLVGSASTTPS